MRIMYGDYVYTGLIIIMAASSHKRIVAHTILGELLLAQVNCTRA